MWTYEMTSLVITLASCWVLGGATVTQDGQLYSNIGIDDNIFMEGILFEYTATSAGQCALQCNQHDSCATFTFHQSTCRGHGIPANASTASQSAPGASSFAKKSEMEVADRCEGTGVMRLTDTSLGLDMDVYCEDGWLMFQRRQDGSVDFFRNWYNYTNGFGDVNGEYWLGLESLHRITTSSVNYEMRVDLVSFNGTKASVFYSNFTVGPATDSYRLDFGSFLGGSTDDNLGKHRGFQFSTLDVDNDDAKNHCAVRWKGGWWYRACVMSNLNGFYETSRVSDRGGIIWKAFDGFYSLKSCQMMIRAAVN